jgi:hypothetical protein
VIAAPPRTSAIAPWKSRPKTARSKRPPTTICTGESRNVPRTLLAVTSSSTAMAPSARGNPSGVKDELIAPNITAPLQPMERSATVSPRRPAATFWLVRLRFATTKLICLMPNHLAPEICARLTRHDLDNAAAMPWRRGVETGPTSAVWLTPNWATRCCSQSILQVYLWEMTA